MFQKSIYTLLLLIIFNIGNSQYYSTALGLNGTPLKTALHNIIKNHQDQGWPLWPHFYSTDDKTNNILWDIYSDNPSGSAPYIFYIGTNQCGQYSQESDCYNHEHLWPSTNFNDGLPMKTDLHHVYPTDGFVNNKRSNYPFGKVNSASWTSQNGSKLGSGSTFPNYTDKIFEPIDAYKGDVARVYFYMSTRYLNEDAGWKNWEMANGAELTPAAITLLLQWHHNDPVSQKEIDRNQAVYNIQGNKNPFIDYPQFADCIWGTADCKPLTVNYFQNQNDFVLYPNPSSNYIELKNSKALEIYSFKIVDMMGNIHFSQKFENEKISIEKLSVGNYILILNSNNGIVKKQFCKN